MSIRLNRISKSYDSVNALLNIDLEIENGKTTILIGPSGCGKSTLIRLITGIIKPDNGEISIDKEILSEANLISIRRRIGYVIQEGGLFPHLNARENVTLLADYLDWGKEKIKSRVDVLASLTKFPIEGMHRYPAELSGGQKQRVSLMRALMLDPEFLLFDEPLVALDPLIRFDLQEDLKEIFKNLNKTVLLVTHDLNEAAFFGDRIVLMKDGAIVQEGTINDLIKSPANDFVTKFIKAQRSMLEIKN
jgi:osmoprotectant transport system ATP-binding protein